MGPRTPRTPSHSRSAPPPRCAPTLVGGTRSLARASVRPFFADLVVPKGCGIFTRGAQTAAELNLAKMLRHSADELAQSIERRHKKPGGT
eukprot:1183345-Prymnesium_polylepis.1